MHSRPIYTFETENKLRRHALVYLETKLLQLACFVFQSESQTASALVHSQRRYKKLRFLRAMSSRQLQMDEARNRKVL